MTDARIFNIGLELALEFGPHFLQPIHSRLSNKFPDLTANELDTYNERCTAARKVGHQYVYNTLEKATHENRRLKEKDIGTALRSFMLKDYPWIDADNLRRIMSQGFYFAWKDGLDNCIVS